MNNSLLMPSLLIEQPIKPVARLVLAHGAGADASSDFMQWLTNSLLEQDIEVWRFNFPYMQQQLAEKKKRLPNSMEQLRQAFLQQLQQCPNDLPLFIGGKSMGSRVASTLATDACASFHGVVAYGYPFHALKKQVYRTDHFVDLQRPMLVLQGQRDLFGSYAEVNELNWPSVRLHWLEDGDHSFKPRKKSGLLQMQLIEQAAKQSRDFIDEIMASW